MINGIIDYFKQWLNLLYLIPSTICVLKTFINEENKDTLWMSLIDPLTKTQMIFIFIAISIITGINITMIKNKIIFKLKNKIKILKQNVPPVHTTVNNNYYGDIIQWNYVNSNVIIGDKSKINKK